MTGVIKTINSLGFVWETSNPFLFCVHHQDAYPQGNGEMGPAESLAGRDLGQDFDSNVKWRMYHGKKVPGFPVHPHRGFETVTIVLEGFVDHFDSGGATGRYGQGDVQWMTAGSGLQHSEMFPLVYTDRPNSLDLFQIWLNLPKADKFVDPHYKMLWSEDIPIVKFQDSSDCLTNIRIISGNYGDQQALEPAPDSWAFSASNQVAIWIISMEPEAQILLPAAVEQTNRSLYFFEGTSLTVDGREILRSRAIDVYSNQPISLKNGSDPSRILLLQGNAIDEQVVQYGPFVMNTRQEIQQAFADFHRTQFGGWPWERSDPVHPASKGRFAQYHDGSVVEKE
ncbi:MAG: pirin family protein [Candidatus Heimdallarchaeota archaeon]